MKHLLASTALALALAASPLAHATCVLSTPIAAPDPTAGTTCSITASASTVDVVFAFANAADVDLVIDGTTTILSNVDPRGTEVSLTGLTVGQPLDLTWKNMNTGDSFQAGVVASDGEQHIAVRSTYADFQTDPPRTFLTQADLGAAYGVMAGLAPLNMWTFVGMEDLLTGQASDFDFNDIVFGFLGVAPAIQHVEVPEPQALALLGTFLLLLGFAHYARHRRTERAQVRAPLQRLRFLNCGVTSSGPRR